VELKANVDSGEGSLEDEFFELKTRQKKCSKIIKTFRVSETSAKVKNTESHPFPTPANFHQEISQLSPHPVSFTRS
jgi:hypothetical protein